MFAIDAGCHEQLLRAEDCWRLLGDPGPLVRLALEPCRAGFATAADILFEIMAAPKKSDVAKIGHACLKAYIEEKRVGGLQALRNASSLFLFIVGSRAARIGDTAIASEIAGLFADDAALQHLAVDKVPLWTPNREVSVAEIDGQLDAMVSENVNKLRGAHTLFMVDGCLLDESRRLLRATLAEDGQGRGLVIPVQVAQTGKSRWWGAVVVAGSEVVALDFCPDGGTPQSPGSAWLAPLLQAGDLACQNPMVLSFGGIRALRPKNDGALTIIFLFSAPKNVSAGGSNIIEAAQKFHQFVQAQPDEVCSAAYLTQARLMALGAELRKADQLRL